MSENKDTIKNTLISSETSHKESENMNAKSTSNDDTDNRNTDNKDENALYKEDALALAGLSFKEKLTYKNEIYKNRISSMSTKEKINYTIGYYKWYFLGTALFLICICWGIRTAYRTTLPTILGVAILNGSYNETAVDYIPDAFRNYYHLDNKNFFNIYTDLFVSSTEDTEETGTTMTDYQKIGFYYMNDILDVIICDEEALALYISSEDTTAIDLCVDEELYDQIEDYIITMSDPSGVKNDGKPYAAAIDISNTKFVKDCNISYDKVYLMILSKYLDNQENINDLIRLIFSL